MAKSMKLPIPRRSFRLASLLLLALHVMSPPTLGASDDAVRSVDDAIASIRGHDPRKMTEDQLDALHRRLDDAWNIMLDHPKVATVAIRKALNDEHEDSLLIVDLSQVLIHIEDKPSTMVEVSTWIQRADPNVYPPGYFRVASIMGAERCQECLPSVVRMLELDELKDGISDHALPVGLDLGLLFSLGPYGEAAEQSVIGELQSTNCIVRRNAALAAYLLLPDETPRELSEIVVNDPCVESRISSWRTLGLLDGATLTTLARKVLSRDLPGEELTAIVVALAGSYDPSCEALMKELAGGDDERVREASRKALEETSESGQDIEDLLRNLGSSDSRARSRALKSLRHAQKKGYFDFSGSAFDLEAAVKPSDLSLLKSARASVLRRRSDECLYEWQKLNLASTVVRYAREN